MKKLLILIKDNSTKENLENTLKNLKNKNEDTEIKIIEKNLAKEMNVAKENYKYITILEAGDEVKIKEIKETDDWDIKKIDDKKDWENKEKTLIGEEIETLLLEKGNELKGLIINTEFIKKEKIEFKDYADLTEMYVYIVIMNKANKLTIEKECNIYRKKGIEKAYEITKSSKERENILVELNKILSEGIVPRRKTTRYEVNKRIIKEVVSYSLTKEKQERKELLKEIIKTMNEAEKDYHMPLNVNSLNFYLFRKRYIQNEKIEKILKVIDLIEKNKLEKKRERHEKWKEIARKIKISKYIYDKKLERKKTKAIEKERERKIEKNKITLIGDSNWIKNYYCFFKENDVSVKIITNKKETIDNLDCFEPKSIGSYREIYTSEVIISDNTIDQKGRTKEGQKRIIIKAKTKKEATKTKLNIKKLKKEYEKNKNKKKQHNLVVFESFGGRQANDNPYAIYEYLKNNHPEYELIWVADPKHKEQFENLNYVEKYTKEWINVITEAKFWVSNARNLVWIKKPNKTIYIQTWHGTPLKKLALDMETVNMPNTTTEKYKSNFKKESNQWDILVAPNKYSKEIFRRAFGYSGVIMETGYPRNDYLIKNKENEKIKNEIKEKLGISKEKKIIMYAPTWRDDEYIDKGEYKFNLKMDFKKLKEKYGSQVVIILRMHYLIADKLDISEYEEFAKDFSKYPDIKELYLISDALITDYSSVFFDYSLLEKPIVFFAYDIEKYEKELRGFYYDYKKQSPGIIATNNEELIIALEKILQNQYGIEKERKEFMEQFAEWEDGESTKKIVEEIILKEKS